MVIIFVLLVFVLAQAFLTVTLSGRSHQLDKANQRLAELADALSLEQGKIGGPATVGVATEPATGGPLRRAGQAGVATGRCEPGGAGGHCRQCPAAVATDERPTAQAQTATPRLSLSEMKQQIAELDKTVAVEQGHAAGETVRSGDADQPDAGAGGAAR